MAMNFSHMKKVAEDGKTATFKHPDGHEIKVATGGLSPAMKKELAKLPLHSAKGNDVVAKTAPGDVQDYNPADVALQSVGVQPDAQTETPPMAEDQQLDPHALPMPTPGSPGATGIAPPNSGVDLPNEQVATDYKSTQPNSNPVAKEEGPEVEDQATKDVTAAAPAAPANTVSQQPQTPIPMKQELADENAKVTQDLALGLIKPEQVFNHPSTLGKLGTLFGLMVGGAGAGLSHQPNALLEMMNKELERDGQYKIQGNKTVLDMYKLHQEKQLQNAQIGFTNQQIAGMKQDLEIKHEAFTRMTKNRAYVQKMADIVKTMPPGSPEYQNASQALIGLSQIADAQNMDYASLAEGKSQFFKALTGGQPAGAAPQQPQQQNQPQQNNEESFKQRQSGLPYLGETGEKRAKFEAERHFPNVPGTTSVPIDPKDRDQVQAMTTLDNKVRDVQDYVAKHSSIADQANPEVLKTAKQKAEELTSFYNKSTDSLGMTEGRLGWLEKQIKTNPTSLVEQLMGNNATLEEIKNSNSSRRDSILKDKYGLKSGYPQQSAAPTTASQIPEGATGTHKGVKVIRKGGKWIPM